MLQESVKISRISEERMKVFIKNFYERVEILSFSRTIFPYCQWRSPYFSTRGTLYVRTVAWHRSIVNYNETGKLLEEGWLIWLFDILFPLEKEVRGEGFISPSLLAHNTDLILTWLVEMWNNLFSIASHFVTHADQTATEMSNMY